MENMNDLDRWRLLFRVAEMGSIVAAANEQGIEPSSVSRRINALEKCVGYPLLKRSTKQTALTPHAEILREPMREVIRTWDDLLIRLREMSSKVAGTVVISAPHGMGQNVITALLLDFYRQYPDIEVEVRLNHSPIMPAAGSTDVSFCYGPIKHNGVIARHIWTPEFFVCASPTYLDEHGDLAHPRDLENHTLLMQESQYRPYPSALSRDHEICAVRGNRILRINDAMSLRQAALSHAGICVDLPSYLCRDDLQSGRLVRILKGWSVPALPLFVLRSARGEPTRCVSLFFDWISMTLQRVAADMSTEPEMPYRQPTHYPPMWGGA